MHQSDFHRPTSIFADPSLRWGGGVKGVDVCVSAGS